MRFRPSAPGSLFTHNSPWKAITGHSPYVLQTHDIISFRLRTYAAVEPPLKTRHFKFFILRTYRKSPRISPAMNTYRKPRGVGGDHPTKMVKSTAFCFQPIAYSTYNVPMPGVASALKIRPATEADTPLVFDFIRKLAEYGDLSDEV